MARQPANGGPFSRAQPPSRTPDPAPRRAWNAGRGGAPPGGVLLIVLAGALGLAARSLWDHVQAVAAPPQAPHPPGARA